ncbi:MAG: hypothetical protein ACMUIS_09620 [bacterium]
MISILLLGIIVIGSFYSYSLVHHRILAQREQRNALGVLQGWMEETTSFLLNYADPNDLTNSQTQSSIENVLRQQFVLDIPNAFARGITVVPDIDLSSDPSDSRMIRVRLRVTIDGLPTALYSEVYTR